ncbi:MAG TPA: type IV pilus biogenesis/stability protein PilW [Burkholderiales bacterium]|jgi:type IV pilus assembly protein PilF|nr:type IV pilus biogenesis/stability protein PilW [Burkholderiales bacterium]
MTARALMAVLACVLAAGCATQPASDPALKPATPTMGDEDQARNRARIHTELAAGYYAVAGNDPGRMGIALEEVTEALKIDPSYGPAYNVQGLVYASLKRDDQAEASFKRALAINPLDSDANHNYGQFLCERNREQEGIAHFLAATRNPLYRTPDRSLVNAGVCARRQGNIPEAERFFQQALQIRPRQPQALYNLSDLSYGQNNFQAAKKYMDFLVRVAQPNPEALWLAVRIERRLGDAASAASYAQQLRKNFPDSKETKALSAGRFE